MTCRVVDVLIVCCVCYREAHARETAMQRAASQASAAEEAAAAADAEYAEGQHEVEALMDKRAKIETAAADVSAAVEAANLQLADALQFKQAAEAALEVCHQWMCQCGCLYQCALEVMPCWLRSVTLSRSNGVSHYCSPLRCTDLSLQVQTGRCCTSAGWSFVTCENWEMSLVRLDYAEPRDLFV